MASAKISGRTIQHERDASAADAMSSGLDYVRQALIPAVKHQSKNICVLLL